MRLRDKKKSNSLEELGYKLYSDSDSFRVYKYENESLVITIFIDKKTKRVQISDSVWISNDEDWYRIKDALSESVRFSAKYGYWQTILHECTVQELRALIKELEELGVSEVIR